MNPVILLVEDDYLIGLALKHGLEAQGATVVGPLADEDVGLAHARGEPYDLAVLDIRIRGATTFGIAAAVRERGRPVIFVTGYGDEAAVPHELRDAPMIQKPADVRCLHAEIVTLLGRCAERPDG